MPVVGILLFDVGVVGFRGRTKRVDVGGLVDVARLVMFVVRHDQIPNGFVRISRVGRLVVHRGIHGLLRRARRGDRSRRWRRDRTVWSRYRGHVCGGCGLVNGCWRRGRSSCYGGSILNGARRDVGISGLTLVQNLGLKSKLLMCKN